MTWNRARGRPASRRSAAYDPGREYPRYPGPTGARSVGGGQGVLCVSWLRRFANTATDVDTIDQRVGIAAVRQKECRCLVTAWKTYRDGPERDHARQGERARLILPRAPLARAAPTPGAATTPLLAGRPEFRVTASEVAGDGLHQQPAAKHQEHQQRGDEELTHCRPPGRRSP